MAGKIVRILRNVQRTIDRLSRKPRFHKQLMTSKIACKEQIEILERIIKRYTSESIRVKKYYKKTKAKR